MPAFDQARKTIDRDEAWDLIPWYVNSTLSEDETRAVEEHLERDPSLRAEVAAQTRLAEKVTVLDSLDVELERSLGAMRERIRAERPDAGPPAAGLFAAAVRALGRVAQFDLRVMLPLGAAAATIALVLVLQPVKTSEAPYQTLTTPAPVSNGPHLVVKGAATATDAALRQLFAEHALGIVDGPSPAGVYRLKPAVGTNPQAIVDALARSPEIAFVTVRPQP